MIVVGPNRQTGKTSHCIEWLLMGKPIVGYPGWSRIIVCASHSAVVHVTNRLRERTKGWEEGLDSKNPEQRAKLHVITDLRKAVWSLHGLRNAQGLPWWRTAESQLSYCIDDFDLLLRALLRAPGKLPEFVTSTEEWSMVGPGPGSPAHKMSDKHKEERRKIRYLDGTEKYL